MSDDLFDLTGKVAIVTGSTRGIGRAIATRFAQRGAQVVVSSRDAAACEAVAQELREAGGQAIGIAAHVGKKEQLENLVAQTVERCGGVDVLVCNAAVNPYYGPLSGISDDAYDRMLATVVSARWRFRQADADWGAAFPAAKAALIEAFAQTESYSLQQTLYAMGTAILTAVPQICEVRLALPNKHHFLVDLTPFGMANENEVYYAADRPYGLIEGTVLADDAPDAGIAWS